MQENTPVVEEVSDKIKDINEVIAYLAEQFPACFSVKGDAKPIKIGIFKDLAERTDQDGKVSRTVLRTALRKYTSSWRYLAAVTEGAMRVDIDGNEVEAVEKEHAEHALTTLTESKQKAAEKRKEQNAKKPAKKGKLNIKRAPRKNTNVEVKVKKSRKVDTGIFEGKQVRVALGKSPINATIKEINNDEVVVETFTGLTVKTEKKNIIL